jgi:hypothetical protein
LPSFQQAAVELRYFHAQYLSAKLDRPLYGVDRDADVIDAFRFNLYWV